MKPVIKAIWISSIVTMVGNAMITCTVISGYVAIMNTQLGQIDHRIKRVLPAVENNIESLNIEIVQPRKSDTDDHADANQSH